MLGLHIKVAVEWQKAASGDWTGYAADYSRDNQAAPDTSSSLTNPRYQNPGI